MRTHRVASPENTVISNSRNTLECLSDFFTARLLIAKANRLRVSEEKILLCRSTRAREKLREGDAKARRERRHQGLSRRNAPLTNATSLGGVALTRICDVVGETEREGEHYRNRSSVITTIGVTSPAAAGMRSGGERTTGAPMPLNATVAVGSIW